MHAQSGVTLVLPCPCMLAASMRKAQAVGPGAWVAVGSTHISGRSAVSARLRGGALVAGRALVTQVTGAAAGAAGTPSTPSYKATAADNATGSAGGSPGCIYGQGAWRRSRKEQEHDKQLHCSR